MEKLWTRQISDSNKTLHDKFMQLKIDMNEQKAQFELVRQIDTLQSKVVELQINLQAREEENAQQQN